MFSTMAAGLRAFEWYAAGAAAKLCPEAVLKVLTLVWSRDEASLKVF